MATLTAPKTKIFRENASTVAAAQQMSEEELWEQAAAAMQQMAVNATALADTASALVGKLDAVSAQLLNGGSHVSRR